MTTSTRMHARFALVTMTLCWMSLPHEIAAAQTTSATTTPAEILDPGDVPQTCVGARTRLLLRPRGPHAAWVYSRFALCPGGPARLAELWAAPPDDPASLKGMVLGTRSVADRRILDAVLTLASNASAESRHRRAALDVTLGYYRPKWTIHPQAWDSTSSWPSVGSRSHESQEAGPLPLDGNDRSRIVAAWRALAASEPDVLIRKMARELLLVNDLPPGAP